jgi:hypothetical protein
VLLKRSAVKRKPWDFISEWKVTSACFTCISAADGPTASSTGKTRWLWVVRVPIIPAAYSSSMSFGSGVGVFPVFKPGEGFGGTGGVGV